MMFIIFIIMVPPPPIQVYLYRWWLIDGQIQLFQILFKRSWTCHISLHIIVVPRIISIQTVQHCENFITLFVVFHAAILEIFSFIFFVTLPTIFLVNFVVEGCKEKTPNVGGVPCDRDTISSLFC